LYWAIGFDNLIHRSGLNDEGHMSNKLLTAVAVAALSAALLSACGGGSSPSGEQALTISGTPPNTAQVGLEWRFEPTINPKDGNLTVDVFDIPDWVDLVPSTGLMYGVPGEGDVGAWEEIRVQVTNGSSSVSLPSFSIHVVAQGTYEGTALLSWLPPTERVDGSPIGELGGYRILYGEASGRYDRVIAVNDPGITSYLVEDLGPGTWYFALVAITSDGIASTRSNELSKRM
jgi:hypothetical protein